MNAANMNKVKTIALRVMVVTMILMVMGWMFGGSGHKKSRSVKVAIAQNEEILCDLHDAKFGKTYSVQIEVGRPTRIIIPFNATYRIAGKMSAKAGRDTEHLVTFGENDKFKLDTDDSCTFVMQGVDRAGELKLTLVPKKRKVTVL